ncbi:hypothetical protein GY45DRAFT_866551 [Cubamyces sp. BRFM 1775]|nr:hypothetical protein GY45DRAFT_866551 [Cubamyces sp. BRFM 1775]
MICWCWCCAMCESDSQTQTRRVTSDDAGPCSMILHDGARAGPGASSVTDGYESLLEGTRGGGSKEDPGIQYSASNPRTQRYAASASSAGASPSSFKCFLEPVGRRTSVAISSHRRIVDIDMRSELSASRAGERASERTGEGARGLLLRVCSFGFGDVDRCIDCTAGRWRLRSRGTRVLAVQSRSMRHFLAPRASSFRCGAAPENEGVAAASHCGLARAAARRGGCMLASWRGGTAGSYFFLTRCAPCCMLRAPCALGRERLDKA